MLMSLSCFPEVFLLTLNCLSLYIKTHEHEFKHSWNIPPPQKKGSFFETDHSPHHTDWYRFAQDLSPIHVGVYDIKNLVVETLKPKQPDDKGNFNFHGPDL